jgi:hypothetical protein
MPFKTPDRLSQKRFVRSRALDPDAHRERAWALFHQHAQPRPFVANQLFFQVYQDPYSLGQ